MAFWDYIKDWIYGFLGIDLIMEAIESGTAIPPQAYVQLIFSIVTIVFGILNCYCFFYLLVGIFAKAKTYPEQPKDKKYAFILSARNEEAVLGNLIDSIRDQDYPQELIDIYVIADNCSPGDKTAEIARKMGCTVYERHDPEHARKGYALEWGTKKMAETIDLEHDYYAYFFFDSDNVLAPNFLSKMHDAMVSKNFDVCLGYRNVKNLNENWITAFHGIDMYRNVIANCRPRAVLGCHSQFIPGTGFALRSYLLKDGWHGHQILEDGEMSIALTIKEAKFGFVEEAEFYDEQPSTLKISLRQRFRWCKGGVIIWWNCGRKLAHSFFKKPTWQKYDSYWHYFPFPLLSFIWSTIYQIIFWSLGLTTGFATWASAANFFLSYLIGIYIGGLFTGTVVIIREWRRVHLNVWQAILSCFVWPFWDITSIIISIVSIFVKITWKPIPHKSVVNPLELQAAEEAKIKKKKQ